MSTNLIVYFVEGILQFSVDRGELLKVSVGLMNRTEDLINLIYGLVHGSLDERQKLQSAFIALIVNNPTKNVWCWLRYKSKSLWFLWMHSVSMTVGGVMWRELSPCWTRQLLAPEVPRAQTHWSTSLNRCPPLLGTEYHQTPPTPPAHWMKYSVKCN